AHIQKLRATAQARSVSALQYNQVIASIHKAEKSLATIMQQLANYEQKYTQLSQKIADLEKRYTMLTHDKSNAIDSDSAYLTITENLGSLEKQLAEIQYNSQEHHNTQLQLQEIENKLLDYAYIQQEQVPQEQRKQDISTLCHTI